MADHAVHDAEKQIQNATIGIASICSILSILMILLAFKRFFVIPITIIGKSASAIANGENLKQIPIFSKDELGDLARNMETMSGSIQAHLAEIKKSRDELEIRVKKRTEALENAEKSLQTANEKLLKMAMQDGLTQIANRRSFDMKLTDEWHRMMRNKKTLSLVIFDVDHFKFYNDTYGHQAGDICLQIIAKKTVSCLKRPGDFLARYGGEEFAAILPDTTIEGATILAENMRHRIHGARIQHNSSPGGKFVTISCGISSVIPSESTNSQILLETADRALYEAKRQGRNRVVFMELK